jgi:hypothetical protein
MILYIGLDPWILADGNYEDFQVGDERKFALEFSGENLLPADEDSVQGLQHLGSSNYSACGEVTYSSVEMSKVVYSTDPNVKEVPQYVWVCDFGGVQAYCNHAPPDWARVGALVAGEIYLGIDHYYYFEFAHKRQGMPKITHEFAVRAILLEERLMVLTDDGQEWIQSGETEVSEVESTAPPSSLRNESTPTDTSYKQRHFVLTCEIVRSGVDPVVGTG